MTNGADRHQEAVSAIACLSVRELDVLRGIIQGGSNKSIGRALDISPRTVEIHRASLKRKISASSTADAIRIGIYAGLDSVRANAPAGKDPEEGRGDDPSEEAS